MFCPCQLGRGVGGGFAISAHAAWEGWWKQFMYFCPIWAGRGGGGGSAISAHADRGGVEEAVYLCFPMVDGEGVVEAV